MKGSGVLGGPVAVEEGGDEAFVLGVELPGAVLGAGLGEPGADLVDVAVNGDRLPGRGGAALAAEEQLEEPAGLGEGAPGRGVRGG